VSPANPILNRLMSACWHIAAFAAPQHSGRYWSNSGQMSARALNGSVANDPKRTLNAAFSEWPDSHNRLVPPATLASETILN
jgi:hypothetical protein